MLNVGEWVLGRYGTGMGPSPELPGGDVLSEQWAGRGGVRCGLQPCGAGCVGQLWPERSGGSLGCQESRLE